VRSRARNPAAFTELERIVLDPDQARIYAEGWQSWTPTTTYRFRDQQFRPASELAHRSGYGGTRPVIPADQFQADGFMVVDPGNGGNVLAVCAATPTDEIPVIRATRDGNGLVLSAAGDVEVRWSDPAGGIRSAQAAFGERVRQSAGHSQIRPAPTIWCSWYQYFTAVTEADIVENIAEIDRLQLPVDVIQLDDGYQREIGDWMQLSDRFESLSAIVQRIEDTGRRAGVWLAPFLAGARSAIATDNPDWLVRDDGEPLVAIVNWEQDNFALDLTHPGVRDYLGEVFGFLLEVGFDFFKLDFVYAGALDGLCHDPDVSGVQAYRSGLDLIRELVGDAYLLGCGAPILPSVGKVDAMRISSDTAPHWRPTTGEMQAPGGEPALLGGMARCWQHGRFWVNDPDCFLVRPSVERRELLAQHTARYGGLRGSSDRIAELDDWGLHMTRELLSAVPPPTPFDCPTPDIA
jgi:alpha-galactosidase